ncbi:twitching motility protein PilT [Ectothiorhodospiraceae bacterium 2226]|nr:twitching motility protein PilT [Ectothiorhodospiraceae bacterium 2226]
MRRLELHVHGALRAFVGRRPDPFSLDWRPGDALKHRLEALGIPHTEIGALCVERAARGWDWHPGADAVLDVYPYVDAHPDARALLHPPLARPPAFAADAHLGRLANHLRLLGFDTLLPPEAGDAALARLAAAQGRVLLTRDRNLLMHRVVAHGAYVRAQRPREQLLEVVRRYDLGPQVAPFTRCLRCNGTLDGVSKAAVADRLPPQVAAVHGAFTRCRGCGRVYWPGSHYRRLDALVREVQSEAARVPLRRVTCR